MNYIVSGIIKFQEESKLKLLDNNKLIFYSPRSIQTVITPTETKDLNVEFTFTATNENEAGIIAELELERISNLISYFHTVPILEYRIDSISSQSQNAPNKKSVKISVSIVGKASISVVKGLGVESLNKLKDKLEKVYPEDFEEIIQMWCQAISEKSQISKYLLLYRILELLFEQNTDQLTNWIKRIEPKVPIYEDRRRGGYTIYTYLRDCLHPKAERRIFPVKEVSENLPKLQNLIYKKIREQYGESVY